MPSLYEINKAILETIDEETGEIIDFEALEQLQMEREKKLENVALFVKNLEVDALAYKTEKEAFEERQKSAEKKAERLKEYLATALNGQKFETAKCSVSFRKSEQLQVADESLIPKEYMVEKVTYQPDKKLLKEVFKAGKSVEGCQLINKLNVNIK